MASANLGPWLADDAIVYGSASGAAVITRGDWVSFSSYWLLATNSGTVGTPHYKASGVGIALANQPWYDELGVARSQSALPVATRGIFRVTAMSGDSASFPLWTPVFPSTTGSGIVGQTAATGIGSIWVTAPLVKISANPTGALASGIGRLLKIISDGSTGQWDIIIGGQFSPDYF
jgi:hypothetical protein